MNQVAAEAEPGKQLILKGRQGKSVAVEGNVVSIIKNGIFSAKREKALPIRNITSVEVKKPGIFYVGFIQFSIAGGKARDSSLRIDGGAGLAIRDENSVVFWKVSQYETALKIKEAVENYAQAEEQASVSAAPSVADEISKLKKLMDDGVLTKAEFDTKKAQLLGI